MIHVLLSFRNIAAACLAGFVLAGPAAAVTFVVTRFDDAAGPCTPDDCALREAVIAANALPGPDRIELAAGFYALTIPGADPVSTAVPESGDLDVLDELELVGPPGDTAVIVGNGEDRVIEVAFTTVTFSNVTFTGGRDLLDLGGCVRLFVAEATLVDTSITDCFSDDGGGGVAVLFSVATMISTTISENVSGFTGGGIFQVGGPTETQPSGGRLEIISSTISGNRSAFPGGGLDTSNLVIVRHSTITNNVAPFGDVIFTFSGIVRVYNSILEGTCGGFLPTSFGGNLSGPDLTSHCLSFSLQPDDLAAQNLGLGPLADNGGPTRTHALLAGSPAIDAANSDHCEPTDQRGVPRPQGAACDIGAFEGSVAVPEEIPVSSAAGLVGLAILLLAAGIVALRRGSGIFGRSAMIHVLLSFRNIGVACLAGFVLAGPAAGATFVVTRFDDAAGPCTPDDCALREAVIAANALPGSDRIELMAGLYPLTIPGADPVRMTIPESGDLDVRDELELVGPPGGGTAVIIGNGEDRVIEVLFTTVSFSNVTLTGGRDVLDNGGCVRLLEATATFVDSSITDCFCEEGGGGIAVLLSAATMINTTINGNVSGFTGGGLFQVGGPTETLPSGGRLEIINSTISGNRSAFPGGGLHTNNLVIVRHSTIANNEARFGDAIFSTSGIVRVYNSILEGKCTGFAPTSRGGNLSGPDLTDHCLSFSVRPDDIAAENLGLGPLADNGGPTKTHALLTGSPAIDAANSDHCEPTDQRGVPRPQGAACDIGAFEVLVAAPEEIPVSSPAGLAGLAILLLAAGIVALRRGSDIFV